jgi:hypothetical protein
MSTIALEQGDGMLTVWSNRYGHAFIRGSDGPMALSCIIAF